MRNTALLSIVLLLLAVACTATPEEKPDPGTTEQPTSQPSEQPTSAPAADADTHHDGMKVGGGPTGADATKAEEACKALGGTCTGIGSCGKGSGHLAGPVCGAPHLACCVPEGQCGGPEDFSCCVGSAKYRPTCEGGKLTCAEGATRCE